MPGTMMKSLPMGKIMVGDGCFAYMSATTVTTGDAVGKDGLIGAQTIGFEFPRGIKRNNKTFVHFHERSGRSLLPR